MQNKSHLMTARLRLRLAEAKGAIDVIRNRLAHLTGLPASNIETESESMSIAISTAWRAGLSTGIGSLNTTITPSPA